MSDMILLSGMEFYACHGVYSLEKEKPQRFIVDLKIDLDLKTAGRTDSLQDTVDYACIYRSIKSIVEGESFNLLEALAYRIAAFVLKETPAERVTVTVKKPDVRLGGPLDYAGVTISLGGGER